MTHIGAPLDRIDGPQKVCGMARYTAEFTVPRMAHAVMVQSTVANGRIREIGSSDVEKMPGVIAVLTYRNAMKLPQGGKAAVQPPQGRVLSLLQDDLVHYNGQPVAVVVAETFEQAIAGADALRIQYERTPALLRVRDAMASAHSPGTVLDMPADTQRGDAARAMASAVYRTNAVYLTPMEHHNPLEPHATLAFWEGSRLVLHDSTQYVAGVQKTVARTFGIPIGQVQVRNLFVGGGFGGKGSAWSHVVLAAMAARHAGRPVRLVLQRPQMFGPVGGRPLTEQTVSLGCDRDGQLLAIEHHVIANTSVIEDWTEASAVVTRMLYACANVATSHRLIKLNVGTPTFQRAPGEATGSFALESAIDELAVAAGIDPLEMRLRNYAERDPERNLPFSSKSLRECYRLGAERFGWARRSPRPASMRQGRWLVGMGMGTATRPAKRSPAAARVQLFPDGTALVQSSTEDLGTGTYTVMTQIAADVLGYAPAQVRFELGNTDFPEAPISAGSMTVESVGSAVHACCLQARHRLVELACSDRLSPLCGTNRSDLKVEDGWLRHADGKRMEPAAAVIARSPGHRIEAEGKSAAGAETKRHSMHSFGAVFTEVHIDPELGLIRVPRVVGAYGVGRVMNAKTAHSQLMGGIVWGISQALFEDSVLDMRDGRFVNANLAEYHIPVNADIGEIEVLFVPEEDTQVNALGAKGIGEVGMTGVAGALANAVFHATGKRIRSLPITLDKVLGAVKM
ncbi:MAG TPA: xanthine dehydrogenase family protein molybdopterin-binding subunit [Noviherbaspirillum sp.]|uniref:xanthine dehydrogenase family protein molybdopterin-binding subunit n=1 Tax=Noviherbaspirillum sp. TaxID=1926288 RepID=UPI002B473938|nr:xanthine dehydrogenase family protein molybdopterin-binding subunit [Noviherbaspirillum sp.]HJV84696.1 xanthine dehydrogenase family protein molybdopterin-binding subunit [Noviherbaspirillum sp.]